MADAKAVVDKYLVAPTKIPITVPLKSAPPKGKTIIFVGGDLAQFQFINDGVAAAAKAVGWNYRSFTYQYANPATLVNQLEQALQFHPDYVVVAGLPLAVWSSVLPAYTKAGVKIVLSVSPDTTVTKTIIGNSNGPASNLHLGGIGGAWMVADSNGAAHVLLVGIAGTAGDDYNKGVKKALAKCSGCSTSTLNVTAAQFANGQVVPTVISTLQRDPKINYIATITGGYIPGMPAALASAGLTGKVKVTGSSPTTENLQDLANGSEAAFTGINLTFSGWQSVDMALRDLEGMPIQDPGGGNAPTQILTKESNKFGITTTYPGPVGFQSQFKTLWHLG